MVTVTPYSSSPNEVDGQCLQTSEALTGTDDVPSERVTIKGIIDRETCVVIQSTGST